MHISETLLRLNRESILFQSFSKMPVSAVDSLLFKNLFGIEQIRSIFDDKAYIQKCVEVEAALALSQSQVGVLPEDIGKQIYTACQNLALDYDRLSNETEIVGYPILPLVRQLSAACGEEAGKYVHCTLRLHKMDSS